MEIDVADEIGFLAAESDHVAIRKLPEEAGFHRHTCAKDSNAVQLSAGCLSCYRIQKADQRKRSQRSQFRSTNLRRERRNGGQFCTSIREALEKASEVFRQLLYFAFLSQT